MHLPDGFINAGTSTAAAAVAVGGLAYCVRRSGDLIDEDQVPLCGLVAAFIFAAQMVNFPVAGGTSGHLLGGALAAVLVGPRMGAICVAVVVTVQALVFADGGLTALGLNVVNMSLITAFGGYAVFAVMRRALPKTSSSVALTAGIAGLLAVVLSSIGFVAEYAIGGTGSAPLGTVFGAMVGVHTLIGIGEGVITALTVSAVLASRPDLVYGARHLHTPLELRTSGAVQVEA